MSPQRNLGLALGATLVATTGILLANWYIDPFSLSNAGAETAPGYVALREPFWHKALAVTHIKPAAVILGTSRADIGLESAHPGFAEDARPVYNLALSGASIEQIRQLLVHAQRTRPLRLVVIGLDLEAFLRGGRGDFDPAVLAGNRESAPEWLNRMRLNLSWRALEATTQVLGRRQPGEKTSVNKPVGRRQAFRYVEFNHFYLQFAELFPRRRMDSRWDSDPGKAASMRAFRELVSFARQEGIDLRLFISPVHARLLELYGRVGWWPMFEGWKRALVVTLAEEARARPGGKPFPLWDFSGFNSITMEIVPPIADTATSMRWFSESSHYTREHGNLILDRVLEHPRAQAGDADNAGVLIDTRNIETHLLRIRQDAQRYHAAFPGDVSEVRRIAEHLRRLTRE